MSQTAEQFDAIIIGAGQSGGPLSGALGPAGWKTAIIRREFVGGSCINYGCTPTKTMIASARVAHLAGRGPEYGVHTGEISVDLSRVMERKNDIVEMFRNGSQSAIESNENVELIFGEASFSGPKTIHIQLREGGTRELTADTIVINTGGHPAVPPIPGIDCEGVLNSTTIMELDSLPERLIVLGGGYIGLEFGQMFQRFGSQVTVVQRAERLLEREDPDVCRAVADILGEDGIEVALGANAQRIERSLDGQINLIADVNGETRTFAGDALLVAVGRVPNTEALNLQVAGVETDNRGFIKVNDQLETNVPGIYAIGDVNGGPPFTHISYDDFRVLRTNLLEGGDASRAGRMLPYVLFIDPQLGRIGLNEIQARAQGRDIKVFKMPMEWVARALEVDETRGLMKAVVDADTDQILGATILGIEGGELAGAIQLAMMGNLPYTTLKDAVFAHPTLLESLNNLFGSPVE